LFNVGKVGMIWERQYVYQAKTRGEAGSGKRKGEWAAVDMAMTEMEGLMIRGRATIQEKDMEVVTREERENLLANPITMTLEKEVTGDDR
jgi:hypothetical protein